MNRHEYRLYHCEYCFHGFVREELLEAHESHCRHHGPQKIRLPDKDETTLTYKEVHKQLEVPFIIYAV
jgi:hypothetical protein